MDFPEKIKSICGFFERNEFEKASEGFLALSSGTRNFSFSSPRINLLLSHLKILLKFSSRKDADISNFADQLIVIKNHYRNSYRSARIKDIAAINYNIAVLKCQLGNLSDAEMCLKENLSNKKAAEDDSVTMKTIFLLTEIYLVTKNLQKMNKCALLIESYLERKGFSLQTSQKTQFQRKSPDSVLPKDFQTIAAKEKVFWSCFHLSRIHAFNGDLERAESLLDVCKMTEISALEMDPLEKRSVLRPLELLLEAFEESELSNGELKDFTAKAAVQNNMSRKLFGMGQKEASKRILLNLLQKITKNITENKSHPNRLTQDLSPIVCFNLGTAMLKSDPQNAFRFFCEAINLFSHQPLLWYRMGRACLFFYKKRCAVKWEKGSQEFFESSSCQIQTPRIKCCAECFEMREIAESTFPSRKAFKCRNCAFICENRFELEANSYGLSLEDATMYFQRALILHSKSKSTPGQLKKAIHLNMAATCVFLRDFPGAIINARAVLASAKRTRSEFLAALYLSEALCQMGKANEALKWLDPKKLEFAMRGDLTLKAVIYHNLAGIYALKNDEVKAEFCGAKANELF